LPGFEFSPQPLDELPRSAIQLLVHALRRGVGSSSGAPGTLFMSRPQVTSASINPVAESELGAQPLGKVRTEREDTAWPACLRLSMVLDGG